MAIKINKQQHIKDGGNLSNTEFKENKLPATQGNIIETLNAYNDEVNKHYYDKKSVRTELNTLQSGIEKIVKVLNQSTAFQNKEKTENETSTVVPKMDMLEDNELFSDTTENGSEEKMFDAFGLIQKINIIANILSGSTDTDSQNWTSKTTGNNVGSNNSTDNVPTIGITRDNVNYSAILGFDNEGKRTVNIKGLNVIDSTTENGVASSVNVSNRTVLSEKQVWEMIKAGVLSTLGTYDNQISAILGYLLFTVDTLPESFAYVLKHSSEPDIFDAPLYVHGYNEDTKNGYYIRDLNGAMNFSGNETKDYIINNKIGETFKPQKTNWWIKFANRESFEVYRNNPSTEGVKPEYTIPIPQYTISLDYGHAEPSASVTIKAKINDTEINVNDVLYGTDGKASFNLPLGSKEISISLPTGSTSVNNNNFTAEKDTDNVYYAKPSKSFTFLNQNERLWDNYNTVKVARANGTNDSPLTGSGYTGQTVEINVSSVTYEGHTLNDKTKNRESITDKKISYKLNGADIEDSLVWTINKVKIRLYKSDDSNEFEVVTEIDYGSDYTPTYMPVKEGYTFDGWEIVETSSEG